ncbi:MAG TPA: Gfo/Idh/MocA family oxidoreductase [Trebonia sp.]|jgi:predicted dehydrogenase|nr:Gfo/Idh/MocA family oxidoreductase [Trebonia sp.]
MSAATRVAVVGLGKITQLHHLPALVREDDVEIVALCDLSESLARTLAVECGLDESVATTSAAGALARSPDAIVIATTHHGPTLAAAVAAGIPAFVEKPCTWGVDEADAVIAAADAAEVLVQVGYVKQFDPAVQRLRAETVAGPPPRHARVHNFAGGRHRYERIHRVRKPDGDLAPSGPPERETVAAIIERNLGSADPERIAALQTLALLAIHDLNLVRWMWGDPAEVAVSSRGSADGRCFLITLGYASHQVTLEVLADFSTPRDWDEHLAVYGRDGCREVIFGSPFHRTSPSTLAHRYADGTQVRDDRVIVSYESAFDRQMRSFLDDVQKGSGHGPGQGHGPGLREARDDLALVYRLAREAEL